MKKAIAKISLLCVKYSRLDYSHLKETVVKGEGKGEKLIKSDFIKTRLSPRLRQSLLEREWLANVQVKVVTSLYFKDI